MPNMPTLVHTVFSICSVQVEASAILSLCIVMWRKHRPLICLPKLLFMLLRLCYHPCKNQRYVTSCFPTGLYFSPCKSEIQSTSFRPNYTFYLTSRGPVLRTSRPISNIYRVSRVFDSQTSRLIRRFYLVSWVISLQLPRLICCFLFKSRYLDRYCMNMILYKQSANI